MRRAILHLAAPILAAVALAAAASLPAGAHERDPVTGCPYHIDETSEDKPNVSDPQSDWNGLTAATPGPGLVPAGDLYREGTDITKAWINRDNTTGKITGVIEVASISLPRQPNTFFQFLWIFNPAPGQPLPNWFVGAAQGPTVDEFPYGHTITSATGGTQFVTDGTTTGRIIPGTPGRIEIDVPLAAMGNPPYGAELAGFEVRSNIVLGSGDPLPPNPTGLRRGLLEVADDSLNAVTCDLVVNDPVTDPSTP